MEHTTFLREKQVRQRTGLSRSTIYNRISEGRFPKQVPLGGRAVAWVDTEIDAWIADQIARSRNQGTIQGARQ